MRSRRFLSLTLVLTGLVAARAGIAAARKGTVTMKLLQANAYRENGSPAPAKDAFCITSPFLGQDVVSTFDIDVETGAMTASATFRGASTALYPMGLSSTYSFVSEGIPPALQKFGLTRIIFQLDKQFAHPRNALMFPLETGYNCVLADAIWDAAAAREVLSGKPPEAVK